MEQLHTSTVMPDQIDHLGHMNVRYYAALAGLGARELVDRTGLVEGGEVAAWDSDLYVRHHREQLAGASLEVRGGVIEASPGRVRLYEELANRDSGELAATFVICLSPVDPGDRHPMSFSAAAVKRASARMVAVPEPGRWRSVSFDDDPAEVAPPLDELQARDLAMREVREIAGFECDADGWYRSDLLADLVWGGVAVKGRAFQPFHTDPDGRTMGWATMETRASWVRLPRVGDRVQSFGAELDMAEKTTLTGNWVYDIDSGELVCVFSVVNLAFDLESRRSIRIPQSLRDSYRKRIHPDLVTT